MWCCTLSDTEKMPCSDQQIDFPVVLSKEGIELFNLSIEFSDRLRKFHHFFFQKFANFLQSSMSLDILEHVREIPTKFHLNFGEK